MTNFPAVLKNLATKRVTITAKQARLATKLSRVDAEIAKLEQLQDQQGKAPAAKRKATTRRR